MWEEELMGECIERLTLVILQVDVEDHWIWIYISLLTTQSIMLIKICPKLTITTIRTIPIFHG